MLKMNLMNNFYLCQIVETSGIVQSAAEVLPTPLSF